MTDTDTILAAADTLRTLAKDAQESTLSDTQTWQAVFPEVAEFFAAMSPELGLALAEWLDVVEVDLRTLGPLCGCGSGCHECDGVAWQPHARRALAIAEHINAGSQS